MRILAAFLVGLAVGMGGVGLHQEYRSADVIEAALTEYAARGDEARKDLRVLARMFLPLVPEGVEVAPADLVDHLWGISPDQSHHAQAAIYDLYIHVAEAYRRQLDAGLIDGDAPIDVREVLLAAERAAQ